MRRYQMSDRWWTIESDEQSRQSAVIGLWLSFPFVNGQHVGEEGASIVGAGAGDGEEGKDPIWPCIIQRFMIEMLTAILVGSSLAGQASGKGIELIRFRHSLIG